MKKLNTYVIQKDEDGHYATDVPELPGCHTQAKTLDELENRIQDAVLLYLEEKNGEEDNISNFACRTKFF